MEKNCLMCKHFSINKKECVLKECNFTPDYVSTVYNFLHILWETENYNDTILDDIESNLIEIKDFYKPKKKGGNK